MNFQKMIQKFEAKMAYESDRRQQLVAWKRRPAKCGAFARSTGKPCRMKALKNGRCRLHGGLSTGPKTEAGKARALANLKQFRKSKLVGKGGKEPFSNAETNSTA